MKKKEPILYTCPECESYNLLVTAETSFDMNTLDFYCHSVKTQDPNAKVRCQDCEWEGQRKDIDPEFKD